MGRIDEFLARRPESYTPSEWVLRLLVVNARWSRTQGVRRLVEEHELHPTQRLRSGLSRARWRRQHGVTPGTGRAVFLVGVPRSGTNMIVRGLAVSPALEIVAAPNRRFWCA